MLAVVLPLLLHASTYPNERWILRSRPTDAFRASDLALETQDVDEEALADGEVLVAVETLSIEAFYRTTLDAEAYHGTTAVGGVVPALGLGRVVASKAKKFKKGALCLGMLGAQKFAMVPASGLQAAAVLPGARRTDSLGRLGISGLTAWIGMCAVLGPPKRGQVAELEPLMICPHGCW